MIRTFTIIFVVTIVFRFILIVWIREIIKPDPVSRGYIGAHLSIAAMGYYPPLITNVILQGEAFPRPKLMATLFALVRSVPTNVFGNLLLLAGLAVACVLFTLSIWAWNRASRPQFQARAVQLQNRAVWCGSLLFGLSFYLFWDGAF